MQVYREIYTYETGNSTIPPNTNLNPLLGFDGELYVQGAHMFLNGVRSLVSVSTLTGEFCVIGNKIFNTNEIESNSRLMLEIIRIVG
jgi:hypothetical protein